MFITYRQNKHIHTVEVQLSKVGEVLQLCKRLGHEVLKVGA